MKSIYSIVGTLRDEFGNPHGCCWVIHFPKKEMALEQAEALNACIEALRSKRALEWNRNLVWLCLTVTWVGDEEVATDA